MDQIFISLRRLEFFLTQLKSLFVAKKTGYDLSKNDYSDADKTKVFGIEPKAQVNTLESISVNTVPLSIANKSVNIDLSLYALKSDISNVYQYKGSFDAYINLPNPTIVPQKMGWTYNVKTAGNVTNRDGSVLHIDAGDNLAWNSDTNSWDNLGGTIDLSGYYTKDEMQTILDGITIITDAELQAIVT